ncbi:MAG: hypothetical protein HY719_10210 [Planctomycetes bacterium]|nr:hypothetical protein [Planctomycetota bacterium]
MNQCTSNEVMATIGMDLGDRHTNLGVLEADGTLRKESRVRTTREALAAEVGVTRCRVVAVAVARKLAAILHRTWVTGAAWQPEGVASPRRPRRRRQPA